MQALFGSPKKAPNVCNKIGKAGCTIAGMRGVNFVPKVPGKQHTAGAPAFSGKCQAFFDGLTRVGAKQPPGSFFTCTAIRLVVGMIPPAAPHPIRIIWCEQNAQAIRSAQGEKIIPYANHIGLKPTDGFFKIAVLPVAIFQHQPQAGNTVAGQHL